MVEIKGLNKFYGKFIALNNLDLHIDKGELFGFVGPNGAGKTTTMKILSGLLKASGGEVYVAGIDAIRQSTELKAMIGYMPDFFGVYDNLKAIEYMEFYASIYGMYGKQATSYCMELMDLVHLSDKANFYVDSLSRGMKQRLCLARSLVHNPQLLILDEPASGLDPRARFEMKGILKNLHEIDKTIIIVYTICGFMAALGGIVQMGRVDSAFPLAGTGYELNAVASVVIGGASMKGGSGTVSGTIIGAMVIAVLNNGLNLLHVSTYAQQIALGIVIIGAVYVDVLRERLGSKAKKN